MPTKREREYYSIGYRDGLRAATSELKAQMGGDVGFQYMEGYEYTTPKPKRKRKLSAWNKFVKANSKKPRFRYRNGKLNLKKMAVAFRKTPAGRKKRR